MRDRRVLINKEEFSKLAERRDMYTKDVAHAAKISKTTLYNVVNKGGNVHPGVRRKLLSFFADETCRDKLFCYEVAAENPRKKRNGH